MTWQEQKQKELGWATSCDTNNGGLSQWSAISEPHPKYRKKCPYIDVKAMTVWFLHNDVIMLKGL